MNSVDLSGRVTVITGASMGIGLGLARAFRDAGADLHIVANDDSIMEVARGLGATGHQADIAIEADIQSFMTNIPHIDILVNNAGFERVTPLADCSAENEAIFRRIIDINITGTFLVTRAALPMMSAGGRIISTSSIWGRVGEPLFSAYVASKHAIIGMTKVWAKELGSRRITANAICPGWVRTENSLRSLARLAEHSGVQEATLLENILSAQALPGLMEPDDIAGTYIFLASNLASNVTGQSFCVDRGEVPW
ncbi:3-hydroxybutyrate dehydrogenase [Acidocella aquatica]|uniref:3-hydroxybutyrate dehydrogenase n=1 Tax=Acidocella aquatica TaxID=1922313 RepID=A0ABQ6A9Z2_9PROT|nr:SDR family oxidoreductase [Acidocella aquatica]GLR66944.1 3-hydroxybutyrate dehydrogenase [Acidocella aquatica]